MKPLSSWAGRLFIASAIVTALAVVGLGVAQDSKAKDAARKPNVVEVDLSKLPPDLAAKLTEALKAGKSDVKPISLTEAIGIAEKAAKGRAIRAEQDGDGAETQFDVTVLGSDGSRRRVTLDATGKVQEQKDTPKDSAAKGKGKAKKP